MTATETILSGILLLFLGAWGNRLFHARRIEKLEVSMALMAQSQTNLQDQLKRLAELFKGHIEGHNHVVELMNKILSQSNALIAAFVHTDRRDT